MSGLERGSLDSDIAAIQTAKQRAADYSEVL